MFSRMEEKNQKEFLSDYSLSVGLYYVHAIMPYVRATNGVDYSVFLIQNMEESKI